MTWPRRSAPPQPAPAGSGLDPIEDAISAMAAGRPVLVVDNEDRENEGDIIFAAEHATPALMGWTVRYSSGVICVPLDAEPGRRPGAAADGGSQRGRQGHRLHRVLRRRRGCQHRNLRHGPRPDGPDPGRPAKPARFIDPSRACFSRSAPLRGECGNVPATPRRPWTCAGWPGLEPVGVIAELVYDDGEMMRLDGLRGFAIEHGCPLISIADLVAYLEAGQHGSHAADPV